MHSSINYTGGHGVDLVLLLALGLLVLVVLVLVILGQKVGAVELLTFVEDISEDQKGIETVVE